jgi:2-hydroxycyclohexanecarboxyl-CoA dehydrogenase
MEINSNLRRVALVTGSGQGVGERVAIELACGLGMTVIVNDFYEDRAQRTVATIKSAGGNAAAAVFDVTDADSVDGEFESILNQFGPVSVLVNNAGNAGFAHGLEDRREFWETGPKDWDIWLGTNLLAVMHCSRAAIPQMLEVGWGRIVTIVSEAGRVGEPRMAVYGAAKAGAAGLMRGLARSLGPSNVTVNSIALGTMDTEAVRAIIPSDDVKQKVLKRYAIKRLGTPDDAASMVKFLCSNEASWITGQTYPVNGGYSFSL